MNRPIELTSSSNPKIQQVRQLREAKWRRRSGLFLIDGVSEIRQAAEADIEIEAVFYTDDAPIALDNHAYLVTPDLMSKIGYGRRSDQPVAVARTPDLSVDRLRWDVIQRVLVLDRAEKPGNIGACLRTAAACSVDALVLCDPICEVFNPNAIRASRGAAFRLPVAVATQQQLLSHLPSGMRLFTARVDGARGLWECDFRDSHCIVLGNEADGLGENWRIEKAESFKIPMDSLTDSLNLSNSCAIALYEARRQRGQL